MRVLTTRGGALVAPFGPICDIASLATLPSGHPVTVATVADQPITLAQLTAAAADFLTHTGWAGTACTQLTAELAADMAELAADMAAAYPVGTALRVRFDHTDGCWAFIPDPVAAQSF